MYECTLRYMISGCAQKQIHRLELISRDPAKERKNVRVRIKIHDFGLRAEANPPPAAIGRYAPAPIPLFLISQYVPAFAHPPKIEIRSIATKVCWS
jgi:hypothetical protein